MEQYASLEYLLYESSSAIDVTMNQEQTGLFLLYLEQLKTWNQSFNLTAITKDEEIIVKHFIDSLAALRAVNFEPGSCVLDIGTGAGFPGIPLKIVRPDLFMTLLEPVRKKSAFLHFIVGHLRLKDVHVFQETVELFSSRNRPATPYDYLTTRALNPSVIFQNGPNLLTERGQAIIYSAKRFDPASYPQGWNFVNDHTFELPRAHGTRTISVFSHRDNVSSLVVPRGT